MAGETMHYGRWGFGIQEGQDGSLEIGLHDGENPSKRSVIVLSEFQARELAADLGEFFAKFNARLVREATWERAHS